MQVGAPFPFMQGCPLTQGEFHRVLLALVPPATVASGTGCGTAVLVYKVDHGLFY
jgi:hypothetical protein